MRRNTRELVEFLHDVLEVRAFPWAEFPHKVGLHIGCATLRGLRHAKTSEIVEPAFNKPARLLGAVKGLEFVSPERPGRMLRLRRHLLGVRGTRLGEDGHDKVADHPQAGADYIVSPDMSCVMHQQGCARRAGLPLKFIHIAAGPQRAARVTGRRFPRQLS